MAPKLALIFLAIFLQLLLIHPSIVHSRNLKPTKKALIASMERAQKGQTIEGISDVKHFLKAFGYLDNSELNDKFDDSLESSLKSYQKFYGLKVTGKLDPDTLKEMSVPRCGNPDHVHNPTTSGKFHTVGHYTFFRNSPKWLPSERQLTYAFTSDSVQVVPMEELRPIIARAFQKWADVSDFQFQEVPVGQASNIKIGFYSGDHGDGYPFDKMGGFEKNTLAHAFAPRNGRFHYDADEKWSSNPSQDQVDLESVAVHEIGHLLGLNHSSDRAAIMFAEFSYGQIQRNLGQDDINGIRALYA